MSDTTYFSAMPAPAIKDNNLDDKPFDLLRVAQSMTPNLEFVLHLGDAAAILGVCIQTVKRHLKKLSQYVEALPVKYRRDTFLIRFKTEPGSEKIFGNSDDLPAYAYGRAMKSGPRDGKGIYEKGLGWAKLPQKMNLKPLAVRVYAFFLVESRGGKLDIDDMYSHSTIGGVLGRCRQSIQKAISELSKSGLVKATRDFGKVVYSYTVKLFEFAKKVISKSIDTTSNDYKKALGEVLSDPTMMAIYLEYGETYPDIIEAVGGI